MRIVREQVSKQVYRKLHGKLRDQTKEQVRYQLSEQVSNEIYGIVNEEIFVPASQKSSFATLKHILIDDMQKNIDAWRAAGGKAILHTSAPKTIEALKKYDL